jgi:nucleoid DNA-binding protein
MELTQLMESLEVAKAFLDSTEATLSSMRSYLARPKGLQVLDGRLSKVERLFGKWLGKSNPLRKSPRGRYWAPPERKPGTGKPGTLTRDKLVLELQKQGFTFRESRHILKAMLDSLVEELQEGETIFTPLGEFRMKRRPRQKKRKRFGKTVTLNRQPKRVAFQLDTEWKAALRSAPSQEIPMPKAQVPDGLRCPYCGSIEFTEAQFKQYRANWYGSRPGDDLQAVSENPIRALVCLCGAPVKPGALRSIMPEDRASFGESFEVARRYREERQPEALRKRFQESFASKAEHDRLKDRIDFLDRMMKMPRKGKK